MARFPPAIMWMFYPKTGGKGRLKSWTLCDRLGEGVMGQGLAAPLPPPPPPPAHPWCHGAAEGLWPQGQAAAPSALPWPRLGLPESYVGAGPAPDLCEATSSSSHRPPPGGGRARTGAGRAHASYSKKCALSRTPRCPSWCREQQCCCRCRRRGSGRGRGGWGSSAPCSPCATRTGPPRASRAGGTRGYGTVLKGGGVLSYQMRTDYERELFE